MSNQIQIKIKDFYQACVLLTAGFELTHLEQGEGRYFNFVFMGDEQYMKDVLEQYWAARLELNAKQLIASIRELKARLHNQQDGVYGEVRSEWQPISKVLNEKKD